MERERALLILARCARERKRERVATNRKPYSVDRKQYSLDRRPYSYERKMYSVEGFTSTSMESQRALSILARCASTT
jgi:hypothetical protein